jgi:outer membrane lipoprotein LolB
MQSAIVLAWRAIERYVRGTWRHAPVAIAATYLLVACAELPRMPESAPVDREALAARFAADGRLSARRGNDGVAAQFAWIHDGTRDDIELATPLGQTIARLSGDDAGVKAEMPDGRVETARNWDTLTAEALQMPLPVDGLSAWLRGLPRAGPRYTVERDAQNRPALIRQDGWEIVYAYGSADATRASRLTLRYPGAEPVEVRIVVDGWR